mmetsp:Transcript_21922/g.62195  ORF Transcript_21922/g.62195 Transcript_21922/m.62195 type:complete len:273 (+) Transcript_21922:430-1248(+)
MAVDDEVQHPHIEDRRSVVAAAQRLPAPEADVRLRLAPGDAREEGHAGAARARPRGGRVQRLRRLQEQRAAPAQGDRRRPRAVREAAPEGGRGEDRLRHGAHGRHQGLHHHRQADGALREGEGHGRAADLDAGVPQLQVLGAEAPVSVPAAAAVHHDDPHRRDRRGARGGDRRSSAAEAEALARPLGEQVAGPRRDRRRRDAARGRRGREPRAEGRGDLRRLGAPARELPPARADVVLPLLAGPPVHALALVRARRLRPRRTRASSSAPEEA